MSEMSQVVKNAFKGGQRRVTSPAIVDATSMLCIAVQAHQKYQASTMPPWSWQSFRCLHWLTVQRWNMSSLSGDVLTDTPAPRLHDCAEISQCTLVREHVSVLERVDWPCWTSTGRYRTVLPAQHERAIDVDISSQG